MIVPLAERRGQLEIKKSLFIATAAPVRNGQEARSRIQAMRDKHPKCSHVVWAFCTGGSVTLTCAMSDDGEPKGSAGRPVLRVIRNSGITDILITVVRYFGGTKLGRGGLVRAYTQSAAGVIKNLRIKEIIPESTLLLTLEYELYERIAAFLKSTDARIDEEDFATRVTLRCAVAETRVDSLCSELVELTSGRVEIKIDDQLPPEIG